MWFWVVLVLVSTPFSIPSLYLAQRLIKKRFLDSVFNQHIALMMIFAGGLPNVNVKTSKYHYNTGVILPFNLASPLLRLLIEYYPEALAHYKTSVPLICASFQFFYGTWISSWYYMSVTAIMFRSAKLKSWTAEW